MGSSIRKIHLDRGDGTAWCFSRGAAMQLGDDVAANCRHCFGQREKAPGPGQVLRCSRCKEKKTDEWIARAGESERLADERLAHANQLQADIEAEMQGRLELRKRLGAREDETMGAFLERLATMAGVVPADVHERGWQWRPTATDTAFAPPFGTIRQCRGCGCLVAGGPTACARCAEAGA